MRHITVSHLPPSTETILKFALSMTNPPEAEDRVVGLPYRHSLSSANTCYSCHHFINQHCEFNGMEHIDYAGMYYCKFHSNLIPDIDDWTVRWIHTEIAKDYIYQINNNFHVQFEHDQDLTWYLCALHYITITFNTQGRSIVSITLTADGVSETFGAVMEYPAFDNKLRSLLE